MKDFLINHGGAVALVICLNIALSAAKQILVKLQEVQPNAGEAKAASILDTILGVLGKLLDIVSANVEHK